MGQKQVSNFPTDDLKECLKNPDEIKNEKLFLKLFQYYDKDGSEDLNAQEFNFLASDLFKIDIQNARDEARIQIYQHHGRDANTHLQVKNTNQKETDGKVQMAIHLANQAIDDCNKEAHRKQMLANFLSEADLSANQKINYQEFKQFIKRHSTFNEKERIGMRGKFI